MIRLTLNSSKNTSNRSPTSIHDNYEFLCEKIVKYEADGRFCARRDLHVAYTLYKDDPSINEVAIMVTYQIHSRALTMRRVLCFLDRETGSLKSVLRIAIGKKDMANILKDAGIGTVRGSWPIRSASLNRSYKTRVEDHVDEKYVVQNQKSRLHRINSPFYEIP